MTDGGGDDAGQPGSRLMREVGSSQLDTPKKIYAEPRKIVSSQASSDRAVDET